ncbi:monovalent cation/H+ antiporter complex subunit F [Actinomadura rugatobispora]|uniref:Monovalent cation/H+ antiporter complex subunit F n=1 Tax=Actinomadura rugatobispora TaxID=1994 RepID=A0ABW1AJM4_9ACTN|nr:monovalent cation/H+ antiporter complex subunit F [Actinomadura rugatobispora]
MSIVIALATGALFLAAVCTLARLIRGPSMLDRAVALDVLVAITMSALGVHAIAVGDSWALPTLLALSLVGFVGSVSIARFLVLREQPEGSDT